MEFKFFTKGDFDPKNIHNSSDVMNVDKNQEIVDESCTCTVVLSTITTGEISILLIVIVSFTDKLILANRN